VTIDMLDAGRARELVQQLGAGIVAIEQGGASRFKPLEDLRLGLGYLIEIAEEAQMRRGDEGDDRHMRAHHLGQRPDFTGMVHPDLEYGVVAILRHPRQCQRHAPVIVEGRDRCMHLANGRQHSAQRLLGRRLADRTGNGDDPGAGARTRRDAQFLKRGKDVGDHDHRGGKTPEGRKPGFRHDEYAGPSLDRRREEVVPIHRLALDGKKRLAWLQGATIDGYPRHAVRHGADRPPVHGFYQSIGGPQPIHAAPSPSAARTSSWSEKGSVSVPMVWPSSCPLPATISVSPARSNATASWIALRRSPISIAPGAAARMAARISAGTSERGLSSVTITTSASRVAISPIMGRLPRSRSPPQPKTTITRPVVKGLTAVRTFSSASGLCE